MRALAQPRTFVACLPPLLVAVALATPQLSAQLDLRVTGGSVPGPVDLIAGPFIPNNTFGVVMISNFRASTPLSVLDPADPRSFGVGLELASIWPFGAPQFGRYIGPTIPIPNQMSFIDSPLYFQAMYLPGPMFFVGPLSRVQAVWFGPAAQFHGRGPLMGSARSFFPTVPLTDGRVLIPGGGQGAFLAQVATTQVDIYNPATNRYEGTRFMCQARSLHTATQLFDGRILVIGGVDSNNDPVSSAEVYDPITDSFAPVTPMMTPRMGHTATALLDGRVLVAGGLSDLNQITSPFDPIFSTESSTEIYDPFVDVWTPGPNMSHRRAAHGALPLPDGRVLLMGGAGFRTFIINIPGVESTTDLLDPFAGTVTPGPSLNSPRCLFSMVDIGGGRTLLAGGVDDLGIVSQGTPTASAEILDANGPAPTFTSTQSMSAARALSASHPIGGDRYLHIGGADGSILAPTSIATSEIYDAATGTWSTGASLPEPRAAFGSYLGRHGQIHVLGGGAASGTALFTTVWYYP